MGNNSSTPSNSKRGRNRSAPRRGSVQRAMIGPREDLGTVSRAAYVPTEKLKEAKLDASRNVFGHSNPALTAFMRANRSHLVPIKQFGKKGTYDYA